MLHRVAELIEADVDAMALVETLETGKPITQARGEVAGAADLWRYARPLPAPCRATATTRSAPTSSPWC